MNKWQPTLLVPFCLAIAACGGGASEQGAVVPTSATITGSVNGFPSGQTLLLTNNGMESISVNANGNFAFAKRVAEGGSYKVSVLGQPSGTNCDVANGSGVVGHGVDSVSNINISCSNNGAVAFIKFYVGVTVSGLKAGNTVTFTNNVTETLSANENGLVVFPGSYATTAIYSGREGGYDVAVKANPSGQTCTLTDASGAVVSPLQNNFVNVTATCK